MLTACDVETVLGSRSRVIMALGEAHCLSRTAVSPEMLDLFEHRVGLLLGHHEFAGAARDVERVDPALVDFVEQWVIDVASLSEAQRGRAQASVGEANLGDVAHALLVTEQRIRLELAWQALGFLPRTIAGEQNHEARAQSSLRAALSEWQAAVVCLDAVDPITTELVRLRCANHHDCHT